MPTQVTESLKDQLADLASKMSAQIPESVQQIMREADERLADSPLLGSSLKVGAEAPSFQLPNATGRIVSSADLLKKGSLVLSFYRGGWCPYCNLELRALKQALPDFLRHGANLVAVSPETPDHSLSTAEKLGLPFEVLSDAGNRVARRFGLVFAVAESLRPVYSQFGIDIPSYNGDHSFELPLPATYVIDQNGTVAYAFVNTDYKRRAEPSDINVVLKRTAAN
jgi:peroxiredoxin